MNRRESIKLIAAVSTLAFDPYSSLESFGSPPKEGNADREGPDFESRHSSYGEPPLFTWLRFGDVKPGGWLKEQMTRDLQRGFAGCLDLLCSEAATDIFATGQITPRLGHVIPGTVSSTNAKFRRDWWNGETQGNWRAGFIMLSYLSGHKESMRKTDMFVQHVLSFQGSDGYLGIYSKEMRYGRSGDLWTQACLLRGLLAYAELTRNGQVFKAVVRCVDGILEAYAPGKVALNWSQSHDLMISDVLERLYDLTGDGRYRDFGIRCYESWSRTAKKDGRRGDDDVSLPRLLDETRPYYFGHAVHTVEHIRVPLWLWTATGREDYAAASRNAVERLERYSFATGSTVSSAIEDGHYTPEFISNGPPDPSIAEFEYCTTKETEATFQSALQKMGNARFADRVERVFFNAAQGARMPDGTAITYLTAENQLHCDGKTEDRSRPERRNKFSPTHADCAVCCNPNAANVAPLYVRGMWMRHRDGGLAALLYGPCSLSTHIAGVRVDIEERTNYPFEHSIEFYVHPEREADFNLYFRNPEWSGSSSVHCANARVEREGDYWRITKRWTSGDKVQLEFMSAIKEVVACNGENALQYGPLLFVQPIPASVTVVKPYTVRGFQDAYYEPVNEERAKLAFSSSAKENGFGFAPVQEATANSTLRPFDSPVVRLSGAMINVDAGTRTSVDLVPIGNAPTLRRLTFPVRPSP